jgi:hypothetical protein
LSFFSKYFGAENPGFIRDTLVGDTGVGEGVVGIGLLMKRELILLLNVTRLSPTIK